MADERNYLEHSLSFSESLHGQEATPAEMVAEFAKYDLHDRTARLEALKADLEVDHLSVDQATKMHRYHSALKNAHELMRKAGR